MKVAVQDILIILGFLLLSCGISKLDAIITGSATLYIFMITWPILLLLLFYSNAELFKWVKNTYAWSLAAGIPSILMVFGFVGYVTHNPCTVPFLMN